MQRAVSAAGDFLLNLVALGAAAYALDAVALSVRGAVLAAAVIAAGQAAGRAVTDRTAQRSPPRKDQVARGCTFGLLAFLTFLAPIPLLVLADAAVPGVEIRGALAYSFTFAALYAVALAGTGAIVLWRRVRPTRR